MSAPKHMANVQFYNDKRQFRLLPTADNVGELLLFQTASACCA
jgi:hypothetical protein